MKRQRLSAYHIIHNSWGFTLFEILLAMIILVIAIIPMVNAFAPALLSSGQGEEQAVLTGRARSTMNCLLDLDFQLLNTNQATHLTTEKLIALFDSQAEAEKESCVYLVTTYPPVVAIIDASSGAGGLLELTVTLKNVKLQTLKAYR
jgi:hypothetical protein